MWSQGHSYILWLKPNLGMAICGRSADQGGTPGPGQQQRQLPFTEHLSMAGEMQGARITAPSMLTGTRGAPIISQTRK